MFLNKRAEEAFINFVKQAKEAMIGGNPEYRAMVSKITAGAINEVVPQVAAMKPEDRDKFYGSAEFRELTDANQNAFKKAVEDANNTMNAVKEAKKGDKVEEKAPEAKTEAPADLPEDKETADLNAVPTAEEKDDVNKSEPTALDDLLGGNDIKDEASLFDTLRKKAEADEVTADLRKEDTGKIEQVIVASVNSQCGANPDVDKETVVTTACADAGVPVDPVYRKVAEEAYDKNAANKTETIEDITAKKASLIEQINNYKPEPNKYEKILTMAKSCANSKEFFQKCAAELDSKENTQQYKGKDMFDGEHTTFGGGDTPKFPGQKAFMGRDGGNPAVESIFKATMKPEVDVYTDKKNRKKVTSIKSQDGIIAFIQPIADDEPEKIGIDFDYNGVVTGEIQKKPEGVGEPKATAAHMTNNYLDTINELSDKKPEQLAGKLPGSKAALEDNLKKNATEFNFNSDLKKKADAPYASLGEINTNVGTIQNDKMDGTTKEGTALSGKKSLSAEESATAIKKIKEQEAQLERASSFIFHIKAAEEQEQPDNGEYNALIQLFEQLKKDVPPAYNAIALAANNHNDDYFRTVIHKSLMTNLPAQMKQIEAILPNVSLKKVREDYFKIAPEQPKEEQPAEKETDTKNAKDNADEKIKEESGKKEDAGGEELADLLGDL